jgi:hypothetical protein
MSILWSFCGKNGSLNHFVEVSMAIPLDPKQIVSSNELLMSQVVSQEAVIRLLVEKGIFSKEEFLKMVRVVDLEIGKMV